MQSSVQQYLLLTPGPLTTTDTVKASMLRDWCTWDDEYNLDVVQDIRTKLVSLAVPPAKQDQYTATLMQGSGTSCVEATIGTVIPPEGKLLVINNGAYGARMAEIASYLNIECHVLELGELGIPRVDEIEVLLQQDKNISHVAMVHCETTTGMLNPVKAICEIVKQNNKVMILDAMSSFGGIEINMAELGVDFLISSANKCIQGVPGFGFVIANKAKLARCHGQARSLSLDLYSQWLCMEQNNGKWRFTSPTHTVRAFAQALLELAQEGGVQARYKRYQQNQKTLVEGMQKLGFKCLLESKFQSPIITSFYSPEHSDYCFNNFYKSLKEQGFVIYPGKVSKANCFRIGNIGDVHPQDIERLIDVVHSSMYWQKKD